MKRPVFQFQGLVNMHKVTYILQTPVFSKHFNYPIGVNLILCFGLLILSSIVNPNYCINTSVTHYYQHNNILESVIFTDSLRASPEQGQIRSTKY